MGSRIATKLIIPDLQLHFEICILFAGPDQGFLRKYIWPWAKFDAMQHDSYFCRKYSGTRAFPVKRKNETNNFVAAVVAEKQYIWKKCPEKCRPRDHPDWEYC